MKEFFRKRMVTLKRRTHLIPLVILAVAFVYYSLNLTVISNTTSLINGAHMGLAEFATMLFSVLSLVCFLNAFPHRKKVNVPMLVLNRGGGAADQYLVLDVHRAMEGYENGDKSVVTDAVYNKLLYALEGCHNILGAEYDIANKDGAEPAAEEAA